MGGLEDLPEGAPLVAVELVKPPPQAETPLVIPATTAGPMLPVIPVPRKAPRMERARSVVERPYVHYVHFHRPLRDTLEQILGAPPTRLLIDTDRHGCTVGLPRTYTGGDRQNEAIVRAVTGKLGDGSLHPTFRVHGRRPEVVFNRPFPPPARVYLSDVLPDITAAKWHQIVWGIGAFDVRTITSVDTDSPHTGLSMGSGKGKSVCARNALAQMLYHGAIGVVLDYKMFSHNWVLRNEQGEYDPLPNCAYAKTPAQMHNMLLWLEKETKRRNEVADASADINGDVHGDVGPPIFVVIEEMNAMQRKLAKYWQKELREPGEPARSPASDAGDELLFVGRQVKEFLMPIGQRLSVKAVSGAGVGGDARDNIGTYAMCDPNKSCWVIPGWDHPLPGTSNHPGRQQIVTASSVTETQGTWMTGAEARWLSMAGTVAEPRHDMPYIGKKSDAGNGTVPVVLSHPTEGAMGASEQGNVPGHQVRGTPVPPPGITIAEARLKGLTGSASSEAVRKQLRRDGAAPAPVGRHGSALSYDEDALYEYAVSMRWVTP